MSILLNFLGLFIVSMLSNISGHRLSYFWAFKTGRICCSYDVANDSGAFMPGGKLCLSSLAMSILSSFVIVGFVALISSFI